MSNTGLLHQLSPAYSFKTQNLNAQYSILPLWDWTQNSQAPEYINFKANVNLNNNYQACQV